MVQNVGVDNPRKGDTMGRMLPVVLEVALLLWALIDCIQTEQSRVRNIPKLAWIFLIALIPYVGPIAWVLAGRPARELGGPGPEPFRLYPSSSGRRPERPKPVAPDDNPQFLTNLDAQRKRQEALEKWEEDLRRREDNLRWRSDPEGDQES